MISQILKVTVLNQILIMNPVADNESVEDNDTTNWDNYEHYDELRQDIDGYWYIADNSMITTVVMKHGTNLTRMYIKLRDMTQQTKSGIS